MTGTRLYCLVTEVCVCEQLAQDRYLAVDRLGVELASQHPNHYITRPHSDTF